MPLGQPSGEDPEAVRCVVGSLGVRRGLVMMFGRRGSVDDNESPCSSFIHLLNAFIILHVRDRYWGQQNVF